MSYMGLMGNSFLKAVLARFKRIIKKIMFILKDPEEVAQKSVVVVAWGGSDELQVQIKSWLTSNKIL